MWVILVGVELTGTCKMGRVSDPFSVVDADLRVKGVEVLSICTFCSASLFLF